MHRAKPKDWQTVKIKDLFSIRDERHPNDGTFPLCSLTIENGVVHKPDRYIREFLVKSKDKTYKKIYKGDLVFNPMNLRWGAIAVSKLNGTVIASPVYQVLFLNNSNLAHIKYFEYTFKTQYFKNIVKTYAEGTLIERTGVSLKNFFNFPVVLPSLTEQRKIISIIETVESVIDKTQTIIDQTQTLKKGLMQELFTRGIPGRHKKFKKTEMGEIPAEWKVVKFGQIVDINPEQLGSDTNEKLLIKYLDISSILEPGIVQEVEEYIFKQAPSRARRRVRSGDIIVSTVRPYLRGFALLRDVSPNLIVSTGFAVLRPKDSIDTEFIYQHILHEHFVSFLLPRMTGSNYPAVRAEDILDYKIGYPISTDEREAIVSILYNIDLSVNRQKELLKETQRLKSALMQALLSGEVRVKV